MKKISSGVMALVLGFCLLLAGAPRAHAAFLSKKELQKIEREMEEKCVEIRNMVYHDEYFDGGCAEWTSDQLILNDIGYWYKGYYNYGYDHGRYWFSHLDEGAVTESSYTQVKYPGSECLFDIMYEFGGFPVYNIVVSWEIGNEDWPEAGHVLYIWCMYDGYVYYSDTFDQFLYKAGHIIKQPVEEFIAIYEATNGPIIGAVHFEGAEEAHFKPGERVFASYQTVQDCAVRSAPALEVHEEDTYGYTLPADEEIAVKGIYTDDAGERWLKIDGGMWVAAADTVKTGNYSTLSLTGVWVPTEWCVRHAFDMTGNIMSHASDLTAVRAAIVDDAGETVLGGEYAPNGPTFSLSEIDEHIYFEHLKAGDYRFIIEAANELENTVLLNEPFTIVDATWAHSQRYEYENEQAHFAPGDCNRDGAVDEEDLRVLFESMHQTDSSLAAYFYDVNGDGLVNLADLALVLHGMEEE